MTRGSADTLADRTVPDAGQRDVLEAIASGVPLAEALELLVHVIEKRGDGMLASVLLLEDGRLRHGAAPSLPPAYNAAIDGIAIGPTVGSCGAAAATGAAVHVEDVLAHPNWAPFRALAREHGLRACWSTPIRDRAGGVLGTFALYYREPRLPTSRDERLIAEATHLASLAIQHDRLIRMEAERRSRDSQHDRLRSFFQHAPVPIAVVRGEELVYEMANAPYLRLVGRDDVQGMSMDDVFPELAGHGILDLVRRVRARGEPFEADELRAELRGPDGQLAERFFHVRLEPWREPGSENDGVIVVAHEVTQRVRARAETEALLRTTADQARILSTLHQVSRRFASNLDHRALVQEVTDAATGVTGAAFGAFFYNVLDGKGGSYTLYTLSGVPREAFSRFPMPRNTEVFGPTFRGEGPVRSDDITQDARYGRNAPYHGMPKGHLPVRSYLAVPVMSRTGKVHGGLFFGHPEPGVFSAQAEELAVGIAAQAAVALDNAELFEATRESERRFRTLAELLPEAIWFSAPDGALEWVGPRWTELTGQTMADAAHGGWAEALHPDDRDATRTAWETALRTAAPFEALARLRGVQGESRWHLGRAVPLRGEDGRVVRWFGSWTDVHDQRTAHEQVDALRAELAHREKLSALGQLVSGVAHEIRTPLTYLATNLAIVQMRVERLVAALPPEQREAARTLTTEHVPAAVEAVDRINHLVADLRAFTRLRGGSRQAARLAEAVREAVDLFRATNRGRVRVELAIEADATLVMDRLQVQQAILNLLQNAVEAGPRDAKVAVHVAASATHGRIVVEDSGPGIPEDVRKRMFDPFYTTKSGGTGLGLSIVKRIAEDHGGTVAVDTGAWGTRFALALPLPPA